MLATLFARRGLVKTFAIKSVVRSSQRIVLFCSPKDSAAGVQKSWDLKGLRQEVNRVYLRTFKKIGKANERLAKQTEEYNAIVADLDNASQERLESCPNPEIVKQEITALQSNLTILAKLEEDLKNIKSSSDERFLSLVQIADGLGISDSPPPKQERGPKKPKGKAPPPRKPYSIYTSADGIEIRVGRGASDNDQLSCDPEHRDGADWWLHVSGCAGSHIVIRSHDNNLPDSFGETLKDAAVLAVVNSKAAQSGKVPVSLVRCRQVSKPPGAKPGLVRLSGDILTVRIDAKAETKRLERLNAQKQPSS
jgi:predicted ribosome quality control (RQC) complex YloA/Tae2 family protein